MSCEYDGCTQTCRGKVSDAEDYCNVLRAYRKGRADRKHEICDFLRELSNGDDVNAKLLKLIEQKEGDQTCLGK